MTDYLSLCWPEEQRRIEESEDDRYFDSLEEPTYTLPHSPTPMRLRRTDEIFINSLGEPTPMQQIIYTDWLMILRSLTNSQGWHIHERDLQFNQTWSKRFNLTNYTPAHLTYLGHNNKIELEKCCKMLKRKYGLECFEIRPARRLAFKWEAKIEGLALIACDRLESHGSISSFLTFESLHGIDKVRTTIKQIQRAFPFTDKRTIEAIIANFSDPEWTVEDLKQELLKAQANP